jgi:hypothetical protein
MRLDCQVLVVAFLAISLQLVAMSLSLEDAEIDRSLLFSLLNSDVRWAQSSLFQRAMSLAFARKAEQSRSTPPRLRILRSPMASPYLPGCTQTPT